MENEKILFEKKLPSVIHKNEINEALGAVVAAAGYPVGKVRWVEKMEAYAGFAGSYYAKAKQLPPIPGGWDVRVKNFTPEERTLLVNVQQKTTADGKVEYQLNKFVLQMFDEYRKEGLDVAISDDLEQVYGSMARRVEAKGHPFLLDALEDFIENMR